MKFGSLFSGIEAASVAWESLGWECAWVSEIDPFACAVLKHRYPHVPNLGDVTKVDWERYRGSVDVLVGGSPCQDFSVAGLRAGLAGDRGQLTLEYVRVLEAVRPRWFVWENVPGVLSADGGRAFGAFLGAVGECGYGFSYAVLDARHFGVPQRRRRVFVVGHSDWRRAAAVLFDRESLLGDSPQSEEEGQVAPTLPSRCSAGGGLGTDFDLDGGLIAGGSIAHTLRAEGFDASEDGTGRGIPLVTVETGDIAATFCAASEATNASGPKVLIAFSCKDHGADAGDLAPTLRAMEFDKSHANAGGQIAVAFGAQVESPFLDDCALPITARNGDAGMVGTSSAVRRITPVEAERLQGFPDGWTDVTYRGKPAADGPRYRSLGNSFAVPVVRWIGERIESIEEIA